VQEVVPVVEPVVEPTVEPSPAPSEPVIEPSEPVVEPSPTPSETEAPASPEPTPSEPTVAPSLPAIPDPTTEPSAEPKPTVAPVVPVREPVVVQAPPREETVKPEPVTAQTLTLPDNPSPQEISAVISEANTILDSAVQGSPEYVKALEVLAEAAVADDPEVPEELMSIPGVGQAAVAVLQAFNALGNLGADISPAVRKKSKQVGSAVIVVGIAASSGAAVRRK
jgi:outer membrane biosynthesis protein TonB